MPCARCSSLNQAEFTSEMMIHFCGPGHLANPGILMFPIVLVCLDCGASHFNRANRRFTGTASGLVARDGSISAS